jgi:methyl-accepting chemotaxis protein/methyl-accepting chemotaxis protein-1 (serine sensor receptor)
MKLTTKLYGIVGSLALTGMLAAGTGVWYLRTLGEELANATGKTAVKLDLINASRARAWEMTAALRGMNLAAAADNRQGLDAEAKRVHAAFQRMGEQFAEIRPLLTGEQDRADLSRCESALAQFRTVSESFERLSREGNFEQLAALGPPVQAFTDVSEEVLNRLKTSQRNLLKESQARAAALQSESLFVSLFMACLLPAIALLAVYITRNIGRTLTTAVSEIFASSGQLAAAASQISSSSQSLAQGSSEQAASLQEAASHGEEIHSMAARNTENSRAAADLAAASREKFLLTDRSLRQMLEAMAGIRTQSGRISKIIRTIDEIAFRTNILALNAAVEAARAGKAGLGFAIVADEVRSLAQNCAQAALETTEMIRESISKSTDGEAKAAQVVEAIRAVTEESARVKELVEALNRGSQEQTCGVEQVARTMTQIEQVTQQTAASAEENAAAAEELDAQSEMLRKIVEGLAAMVGGNAVGGNAVGGNAVGGNAVGVDKVGRPEPRYSAW